MDVKVLGVKCLQQLKKLPETSPLQAAVHAFATVRWGWNQRHVQVVCSDTLLPHVPCLREVDRRRGATHPSIYAHTVLYGNGQRMLRSTPFIIHVP
ncbi:hypothetical protein ACLOJK_010323 [Asimina triloba]